MNQTIIATIVFYYKKAISKYKIFILYISYQNIFATINYLDRIKFYSTKNPVLQQGSKKPNLL